MAILGLVLIIVIAAVLGLAWIAFADFQRSFPPPTKPKRTRRRFIKKANYKKRRT